MQRLKRPFLIASRRVAGLCAVISSRSEVMHSGRDSWAKEYEPRSAGGRGYSEGAGVGGERRGGHRPNPSRRDLGKDKHSRDRVRTRRRLWPGMVPPAGQPCARLHSPHLSPSSRQWLQARTQSPQSSWPDRTNPRLAQNSSAAQQLSDSAVCVAVHVLHEARGDVSPSSPPAV